MYHLRKQLEQYGGSEASSQLYSLSRLNTQLDKLASLSPKSLSGQKVDSSPHLQLGVWCFEEALVSQVTLSPEGNAGISQHLVQLVLMVHPCSKQHVACFFQPIPLPGDMTVFLNQQSHFPEWFIYSLCIETLTIRCKGHVDKEVLIHVLTWSLVHGNIHMYYTFADLCHFPEQYSNKTVCIDTSKALELVTQALFTTKSTENITHSTFNLAAT